MLNGRIYFLGGLYHTQGGFSHLPRFISKFGEQLNSIEFDNAKVLQIIDKIIDEYTSGQGKIGNDQALHLLMANDIKKVKFLLENQDLANAITAEGNYESQLLLCRDQGISLLENELGVSLNPPEIFIVEKLPAPYDSAGYSALTTDKGDEEKHGIEPGIYFPRNALRPFYSKFILLHELIHIVVGQKSPNLLGRGLEEGLAEILGSIFLSTRILGRDLTKNLFTYNRLSFGQSQFWELYLDYTRAALLLYHQFGLDGLTALLDGGREKIKEVEAKCLSGADISLPKGRWDNEMTHLLNHLILGFSRNLVVSPLARYIMPYVKAGFTSFEILSESNADLEQGQNALRELQERILAAVLRSDGATVSSSDCIFLDREGIVRYEV